MKQWEVLQKIANGEIKNDTYLYTSKKDTNVIRKFVVRDQNLYLLDPLRIHSKMWLSYFLALHEEIYVAEPKNLKKIKMGSEYYFLDSGGLIQKNFWCNSDVDQDLLKNHNVFDSVSHASDYRNYKLVFMDKRVDFCPKKPNFYLKIAQKEAKNGYEILILSDSDFPVFQRLYFEHSFEKAQKIVEEMRPYIQKYEYDIWEEI